MAWNRAPDYTPSAPPKWFWVVSCAVLLASLTICARSQSESPAKRIKFENKIEGIVTKISDGDTWYLDSEPERVRAWGFNTPECHRDNSCETAEATLRISEIISGQMLTCEWVDKKVSFERKVVHCFLKDGTDIGRLMIDSGLAVEDCRFSKNYYGTCNK